ncbi:MAG: hypothetical protein V4812_04860 [Pseudomonadota bacterium]
MTALRELTATLLFIAALVLVILLFANDFSWGCCLAILLCFALAYMLWPSKRRGQRRDDSGFLDLLEIFIELPIQLLLWLFRLLGGLFRGGKGDGFDIDL